MRGGPGLGHTAAPTCISFGERGTRRRHITAYHHGRSSYSGLLGDRAMIRPGAGECGTSQCQIAAVAAPAACRGTGSHQLQQARDKPAPDRRGRGSGWLGNQATARLDAGERGTSASARSAKLWLRLVEGPDRTRLRYAPAPATAGQAPAPDCRGRGSGCLGDQAEAHPGANPTLRPSPGSPGRRRERYKPAPTAWEWLDRLVQYTLALDCWRFQPRGI